VLCDEVRYGAKRDEGHLDARQSLNAMVRITEQTILKLEQIATHGDAQNLSPAFPSALMAVCEAAQ
jgi:hypothetical protein